MKNPISNEMRVLLRLLKDYSTRYNARSLSKTIGISHMGVFKILKNLEKRRILVSTKLGQAAYYSINFTNPYTKSYLTFLLQNEAEYASPQVKRWKIELQKLNETAQIGILFGSVLRKEEYKDVDVLLVLKPSQNTKADKMMKELNAVTAKKIHAVKQAIADLKKNMKKDKVVENAVKNGIVLFGFEEYLGVMEDASSKA